MSNSDTPITCADIPVGKTVTVKVPASSANLGPGYDTLGVALGFYDELRVERISEGLEFELSGEGSEAVPRDETHLVIQAMHAAFARDSRGMGSSASAIVAGVAAASGLLPEHAQLSRDQILQVASDLEGHPDNVAPSVYGSLSISWGELGDWRSLVVPVHSAVVPIVAVPDYEVSTKLARSLIPAEIPHEQAAANSGHAALLIQALSQAPEYLMDATVDYLHQGYRIPAMRPSAALVAYLRDRQLPAVISGAGPTVLTFSRSCEEVAAAQRAIAEFEATHEGSEYEGRRLSWRVMPLEIDAEGVIVTQ